MAGSLDEVSQAIDSASAEVCVSGEDAAALEQAKTSPSRNLRASRKRSHHGLPLPSRMTDTLMCTNNMYDTLSIEIQAVLSTYSTKENIVLTILENSSMTDPESCDSVIVGFNHYISKYREKAIHDLKVHCISFFALFALGIFMEYLLYGAQWVNLPEWISASLDIVAWVLVWQFSAFIVFELFDEIKKIKRYAQINKIEYKFKHWE